MDEATARATSDATHFEATTLQGLVAPSLALAYGLLRDRGEAEDAVQESLLRAWRRRGQFHDRGSGPRPWVLTIVANECRDRLRSPRRRVRRQGVFEPIAPDSDMESRAVFHADLERALRRLSQEQYAALVLVYQFDLPQQEVAQILGIRVGTVKSRLNRAMATLRGAMQEEQSNGRA